MIKTIEAKALQIFIVLFLSAVLITAGIAYFSLRVKSSYEKVSKENVEFKNNFAKMKKELERLQGDYQNCSLNRDNLLAQTSSMASDKKAAEELQASLGESNKKIVQLQEDNAKLIGQSASLTEECSGLKEAKQQLTAEKQQLQEALEAEKEKTNAMAWQQEKKNLQKENGGLKEELKQALEQIVKLNESSSRSIREAEKSKKEASELNSMLGKLTKDYAEAGQKEKILEKRIQEAPVKVAELARENKALIKQTSSMHYNLGVFYSKNKQYSRAIAEFEKAVELNPEDAFAHFNLGYIYAEYVEDRGKAVEHFRKYLNYAKSGDKDVDWARKYIITWTSYEAKQPME